MGPRQRSDTPNVGGAKLHSKTLVGPGPNSNFPAGPAGKKTENVEHKRRTIWCVPRGFVLTYELVHLVPVARVDIYHVFGA